MDRPQRVYFALSVPEAIILLYASAHAARMFLVDVGWFPYSTEVLMSLTKKKIKK